jgi:hypothetical protein
VFFATKINRRPCLRLLLPTRFHDDLSFVFLASCVQLTYTDHGTEGGAPLPGLELGEGVFLELRPPAALLHRALQTSPQLKGESHFEVIFFLFNVHCTV